jgi:hypothetical protein
MEVRYPLDHGRDPLNASCSSVSYGYFFSFHDDRDLADVFGKFQHFLQFALIRFHINILGFLTISRPGSVRVGSPGLSINDNFV